MIKIHNKGDVVNVVETNIISLSKEGKQLIQLNKDLVIPALTKIEFNTELYLEITDLIDECVIGEYLEDINLPLYFINETYDFMWNKDEPIIISMYNADNNELILKKGEYLAFIGQYHKCNFQKESLEFIIGANGYYVAYADEDIKVISKDDKEYCFEQIIESDGKTHLKIYKYEEAEVE